MSDAQFDLYRRVAAEARASAYTQPSRIRLAETIESLIEEVDRLRKIEAAGEGLAKLLEGEIASDRLMARSAENRYDDDALDAHARHTNRAGRFSAALDAWGAARGGAGA